MTASRLAVFPTISRLSMVIAMIVGTVTFAPIPVAAGLTLAAANPPIVLHAVSADDGTVSGDLVNTSQRLVRDVRLLVRHTWLWTAEMSPGEDSPGRATYETIRDAIPPGGRLSFSVQPNPPLPLRSDGRFETSVDIVGFTEIGY